MRPSKSCALIWGCWWLILRNFYITRKLLYMICRREKRCTEAAYNRRSPSWSQWTIGGWLKNIEAIVPYAFLKWWYPTTMGFPTKNDHFEVFWGYHHLRKHPYHSCVAPLPKQYFMECRFCMDFLPLLQRAAISLKCHLVTLVGG